MRAVRPTVIVALGATAARAVLGRTRRHRRQPRAWCTRRWARPSIVTYHPSAVLRADERAAEIRAALVADLARRRPTCAR